MSYVNSKNSRTIHRTIESYWNSCQNLLEKKFSVNCYIRIRKRKIIFQWNTCWVNFDNLSAKLWFQHTNSQNSIQVNMWIIPLENYWNEIRSTIFLISNCFSFYEIIFSQTNTFPNRIGKNQTYFRNFQGEYFCENSRKSGNIKIFRQFPPRWSAYWFIDTIESDWIWKCKQIRQ